MQTNPVNWLVLPALNHTLYLHTTVSHSEPHAQRSHHGRQVEAPSKQKTPVEELSFNLPEILSAIGCGIPVLVAGRTPAMRQTDFRHGPTSSPPKLLLVESNCRPTPWAGRGMHPEQRPQNRCSETAEPRRGSEAATSSLLEPSGRLIGKSRLDPRVISGPVERGPGGCVASLVTESSSRIPPRVRPAENPPAELQPTYRTVRKVAGTKIAFSGLTFQGKEGTQNSLAQVSYGCEEPPTYLIIFIFIIIRFKNTIRELFYKKKNP